VIHRARRKAAGVAAALVLFAGARTALAEQDLSGAWTLQNQQLFHESHSGNLPTNFAGVPVNEEGRAVGLTWDGNIMEELHRQCAPWPQHYLLAYGGPVTNRPATGALPTGIRMTAQLDPATGRVVAWRISESIDRMALVIWMDGRPHPPPTAPHTLGGFATGQWRGNTLVATVTHLKDGYLTRNGIPSSNQETLTLFLTRHGNTLTMTGIVRDPVYLADAYPLAQTFMLDTNIPADIPPGSCDPGETLPGLGEGTQSVRILPGRNNDIRYMLEHYGIPTDASLGGAPTMFPEFQKSLRGKYTVPAGYCKQYCCGAMGSLNEGTRATKRYDQEVLMCFTDGI
jgi:hypothetical protein